MNALAASLCQYLCSRNNDIAGYWGIGVLCAAARTDAKPKCAFRIIPGTPLIINGWEITDSRRITDKLVKLQLDSIECRLRFSFSLSGDARYPDGADKYTCDVAVAVTQGGQAGVSMSRVECWPHNPARELRRYGAEATQAVLDRLKRLQE